jgi:exosome complex component CSL4
VKPNSAAEINKSSIMVGDVVTARIEIITQKFAKCSIVCVRDVVLKKPFPRGILRKEDVRATDVDKVEMYKMFRPNDIILAKVIPQIEINAYSLSTALNNSLGVVIATARSLSTVTSNAFSLYPQMVPISWNEMKCPLTLTLEPRKVARVMNKELNES